MLTQDRLKSVLVYDPDTGVFTWAKDISYTIKKGDIPKTNRNGWLALSIGRKEYRQHRLAFLYMTGSIPEKIIHKNGKRDDNRWCNLVEGEAVEIKPKEEPDSDEMVYVNGYLVKLKDGCKTLGIDYNTALGRVNRGWDAQDAIEKAIE